MDNRVLLFYKNKLNSLSKEVNKYNNINKYTAVGKLASFIFAVGLFIFWYFNSIFNILFLTIPFLVYIFLIIFNATRNFMIKRVRTPTKYENFR